MQSGILTERFSLERMAALAPDDWRRKGPQFQSPRLEKNLALRDALMPIARRRGVSVGALAVAWTLAWPGVTAAIVGARSPEQVDGWISAADLALDVADLDEVARAIESTGAGTGPARPATSSGSSTRSC
jgi:aryl-alcohol dehydrogenase-like predicted oxidoreductase